MAANDAGRRFWVETLGCPKNQVDSDKLVGTLLADGLRRGRRPPTTPISSSSTPARSSRRPGRSRSTRSSPSPTAPADGAELVVTGCMAERYGDELAEALPEVDAVAGFGVAASRRRPDRIARHARRRDAVAELRPAQPAPTARHRALGLREGRRGLRPGLRVLRHPVVPRAAAVADRSTTILAEVDAARASARSCSSPRTSPPSGATRAWGERSIVPLVEAVADAGRWVRLLYLYPSDLTDGLIDAMCAHRRARTSTCRCSTCRGRCCAACAAGATATRFLERIDRHPRPRARRRVPLELHRRLSRRDRGRPRPAARASSSDAQLDWCGFFAYSPEDGTYAADLDGARRPGARGRAAGRAARAAGRHHRRTT